MTRLKVFPYCVFIPPLDTEEIGVLGHSYGGNTVLFHGALDERIRFACASGAACSYQYKLAHQLGIEMASNSRYVRQQTFRFGSLLRTASVADRASHNDPHCRMQIGLSLSPKRDALYRIEEHIDHKRYEGM
jgi:predicted alpha/beta superfamily hydrolase